MKKFEYKTLLMDASSVWSEKRLNKNPIDPMINELGQDGWELISVSPISMNDVPMNLLYTFKREIV